ncbi:MAG: PIN domain-containing protein [Chthoniobacterales bacterium]|nr:PIN domain-containing protein [Chthoniobacterales bacterium]
MESPDVNILVHAFRKDSESHELCYRWLENRINSGETLALSSVVLSGFLRIVTHPKIFKNPSSLEEAIVFCEIIRTWPNLVFIEPGEHHWRIFCALSSQV